MAGFWMVFPPKYLLSKNFYTITVYYLIHRHQNKNGNKTTHFTLAKLNISSNKPLIAPFLITQTET